MVSALLLFYQYIFVKSDLFLNYNVLENSKYGWFMFPVIFICKGVDMLNLYRPMEFPMLHTIIAGWSIIIIEGPKVIISKKYCISFSEV